MVAQNKIYKCGSYERLSKEDLDKVDESSSIQNQRLIIEAFAKYNDLKIVKEYVDDGYSGGNFERPGFLEMIDDIEKGIIDCVITKDLSRLGREMYGTGRYIEEFFLEHNIRYIAINDSYDSIIGDSMLGIRLGVNDLYLRDVSKKVKSSFRIKQQKGQYIGSFPCYGYKKDPNDRHHLIIDEEVVDNVKYIYNLALEGYGLNAICNVLTTAKIPIPIVYKKESRALDVVENDGFGVWKHATVKNILTSQMYIGNMVQNTYNKISYNSKKLRKVSDENKIIVENTHDPIVSKEEFYKVQEILKTRSRPIEKNMDRFLLSGLIRCGDCGHKLGISVKKLKSKISKYTYCNFFQRKGIHSNCSSHRVNYDWLEEDIINYLKEIGEEFIKHYNCTDLLEDSVYIFNKDIEVFKQKEKELDKEINKIMNTISILYNDKIEGVISVDVYKNLSNKHESKLLQLKVEKGEVEDKIKKFSDNRAEQEFYTCRKAIEEFVTMKNVSRSTIKALIDKIIIYEKDKEIKVYLRFKELSYIGSKMN